MGLDSVELVYAVEERFGLAIPDEDAERLSTVGLLHEYVWRRLQEAGRRDWGYTQVFDVLRELIVRQLGVHPREVVSEARFVEDLRMD